MMNSLDHSQDFGCVFFHHRVVHLMNAERVECGFLHLGRVYTAFDLSDLNLCHFGRLFAVKHFFDTHRTVLSHLRGAAEIIKSGDSGLNEVVGVGGTF